MSDQPPEQPPSGYTPPGPELPTPPTPPPTPAPPAPPGQAPPPTFHPIPEHLRYATYQPRPQDLPPPSRKMAGWSLGLAIVPCCFGISTLVGIGLAIAVLIRSRDGRDHGKVLAWVALGVAAGWIVVGIAAAVTGVIGDFTEDADRDSSGRVAHRDEISVLKVRVGDCIDYPALAEDTGESTDVTVTAIPCDQPHQFEAYDAFPLDTTDFPGGEKAGELAARGCFASFKDFVGVPYGRSRLEPYVLYPTATSWKLMDDRDVTCLVGDPGRRTTGTLAGSRR